MRVSLSVLFRKENQNMSDLVQHTVVQMYQSTVYRSSWNLVLMKNALQVEERFARFLLRPGVFYKLLLWWDFSIFPAYTVFILISLVSQFSRSVVSDSPWPHKSQHARPPCPSPTPRVYSNSCRLSRWCHPAISSSVVPFSSCLQSFLHQGLFQWVTSSHEVAKVLEFQLQHQSFQWTPGTDLL